MSSAGKCTWLGVNESGADFCRLRGVKLPKKEISSKCKNPERSTICIDAYSSLARGKDAIDSNSTDAFPWLTASATQFESLGEIDNSLSANIKAIYFANNNDLVERAYDFFRTARTTYENALANENPSVSDPDIKQALIKAGSSIIERMKKMKNNKQLTDMQAELKAAVLGGVALKKTETKEPKDLIISHGRVLYEKKAEEYKDGAKSYIDSGMIKNAVILACMGALSDLMLGKPKEGIDYLTKIAAASGNKQAFNEHPCFEWTKMIFKIMVSRDKNLMISAHKLFLEIPWSFKDDREFGRRVMESVERRINAST